MIMTNIEKLNNIFVEVFGVETCALSSDFKKENVNSWDSIHQLSIVTAMEETFDILFDPEDIVELDSYAAAKEILEKYGMDV